MKCSPNESKADFKLFLQLVLVITRQEQKFVKKNEYYRGHPKVNGFFNSLIFTLNHRRPKMSKFDNSVKKIIENIFF
jgi:hypothetical protein